MNAAGEKAAAGFVVSERPDGEDGVARDKASPNEAKAAETNPHESQDEDEGRCDNDEEYSEDEEHEGRGLNRGCRVDKDEENESSISSNKRRAKKQAKKARKQQRAGEASKMIAMPSPSGFEGDRSGNEKPYESQSASSDASDISSKDGTIKVEKDPCEFGTTEKKLLKFVSEQGTRQQKMLELLVAQGAQQ